MGFSRGADWGIWDLHVHTPASLVNHYGGDNDAAWNRFIDELEALPNDVRVIGINDYWFLDGYRRVLAEKSSGRLANLDAIFPVLEMRIEQFGGTTNHLSRVNLHVLFDPDLGVDTIEQQFLNRLSGQFKLLPEAEGATWSGAITRESLTALGQQIKATVPKEHLPQYGSDLMEGFNNLNVSIGPVQDLLNESFLRGRTLLGIGKAEWSQIKWTDQSIASKKSIINRADFVFTAFQDVSRWADDVDSLRASGVTHKLFDCSDAHYFSDATQNERLGQCLTWVNSQPSFAGLVHALKEFDHRVFVGLEPRALARIRKHPERFIERVSVKSSDPETHSVFNYEVPLNSGFVAVVGNKGQGKSALLDCIALAGNSSRTDEFAFLNARRFLSAGNRSAREYAATLRWASGAERSVPLDHGHDHAAPVSVEYLPQRFVERVCSADPASEDADDFERELREILFTHIPENLRAGERTFDGLLALKTQTGRERVAELRAQLVDLVGAYERIAAFRSSVRIDDVEARLQLKEQEIQAAEEALAEAATEATSNADSGVEDTEAQIILAQQDELRSKRAQVASEAADVERRTATHRQDALRMETLLTRAGRLRTDADSLNAEVRAIVENRGGLTSLVRVDIDEAGHSTWLEQNAAAIVELRSRASSLGQEFTDLEDQIFQADQWLATRNSARELARQKLIQLGERVDALRGNQFDPESEQGLLALRAQVEAAPTQMNEARDRLITKAKEIRDALEAQRDAVESLYAPASDFIAQSEVVSRADLQFKAELRVNNRWGTLSAVVDGRKSPDLPGWMNGLAERIPSTDWPDNEAELRGLLARLESERGQAGGEYRNPASTLRAASTLEELLGAILGLEWLEVRFGLTGEGLPLSLLSPGQRGLVLALFYLVVDRRTTPLLLDQPEENLDNATIANVLVPALHEAAGRRQTIVVTHNANLAVVGDADQVIHCTADNRIFSVTSGFIAELDVAQVTVDVLEGTLPAFDNRRAKYQFVSK